MARPSVAIRSVTTFLAGAILLRILFVAGSMAFPAFQPFQNSAQILIGMATTLALFRLNQKFLLKDGLSGNSLGLSLGQSTWFFAGGLIAILFVSWIAGAMWPLTPFQWKPGQLTGGGEFEYWRANE